MIFINDDIQKLGDANILAFVKGVKNYIGAYNYQMIADVAMDVFGGRKQQRIKEYNFSNCPPFYVLTYHKVIGGRGTTADAYPSIYAIDPTEWINFDEVYKNGPKYTLAGISLHHADITAYIDDIVFSAGMNARGPEAIKKSLKAKDELKEKEKSMNKDFIEKHKK